MAIDQVADFKTFINPQKSVAFTGAHIRKPFGLSGCSHFLLTRNVKGIPEIRTKLLHNDRWSEPTNPWRDPEAGLPLTPDDLLALPAVVKPLSPDKLELLSEGVRSCLPRLQAEHQYECERQLQMVHDAATAPRSVQQQQ